MRITSLLAGTILLATPAALLAQGGAARDMSSHDMSSHNMSSHTTPNAVDDTALPPDAEHSLERLNASIALRWAMVTSHASTLALSSNRG